MTTTAVDAKRESASERHAREDRAAWYAGMVASLLLHLALFVLVRGELPLLPEQLEGPQTRSSSGAVARFRQ